MMQAFRIGVLLLAVIMSSDVWAVSVSVKLEGLGQKLHDHVLSYLDISRVQGDAKLSLARLQRLHDKAPTQIKTALQVYGYYQADVQASLTREGETWLATYTVEPGEPIRVQAIAVKVEGEGGDNAALKAAVAKFPLRKDQVFEHPVYDQARDTLFRIAIQQGFLDAQFSRREAIVDLRNYSVAIVLHLQTGKRYYFGPVSFKQDAMSEDFLRRYVRFKPGDPYNPAQLLQLQTMLDDSGLFQNVEVKPKKDQATANQVPIEVALTVRKRHEWRFGLGYATDTGARGSVNYNRIVGSHGDKFESRFLLSETTTSATLGYVIPLADPINEQLSYGVRYSDETVENRESLITGLSIGHTDAWRDWQRLISLNYDREVYTIPGEEQQTGRALYPVYSLTRVVADNRINPRNGYRIYVELRGANKNILSDTNYAQVRTGLKWIRSLSDDSRMILRGDFGSTNVAYLDSMPLSQRFFAGGDNSVRGYAYNELGPKDAFGNVVGGKHLLVGSVEFDRKIGGNWSGAVFYDRGNAINSMGDKLVAGAGVGLRWKSPVGPVRFDFAWALDKKSDRFRLHVVIGPEL
jgi:translocation and assembly module TamA